MAARCWLAAVQRAARFCPLNCVTNGYQRGSGHECDKMCEQPMALAHSETVQRLSLRCGASAVKR